MRPKGWINPWDNPVDTGGATVAVPSFSEVFEAGADAMLERLRKEGMNSKGEFPNVKQLANDPPMLAIKIPNKKGYLVFIPEEV